MAHIMEYTCISTIVVGCIGSTLASYCELYYNDGYDYYSYKKYCSMGCCYDKCCYSYYKNYSEVSIGAIIGIIIGCLVGLGICIAFCVCVFKLCCKSEAPQAGQIIRQPGQQIAYVQNNGTTAHVNNYGQPLTAAYGYPGVSNPIVSYTDSPPPAYEDAILCSSPTGPPSFSPGDVVTNATFTNIATVSNNEVTSPLSVPDVLPSSDTSLPSNTPDSTLGCNGGHV